MRSGLSSLWDELSGLCASAPPRRRRRSSKGNPGSPPLSGVSSHGHTNATNCPWANERMVMVCEDALFTWLDTSVTTRRERSLTPGRMAAVSAALRSDATVAEAGAMAEALWDQDQCTRGGATSASSAAAASSSVTIPTHAVAVVPTPYPACAVSPPVSPGEGLSSIVGHSPGLRDLVLAGNDRLLPHHIVAPRRAMRQALTANTACPTTATAATASMSPRASKSRDLSQAPFAWDDDDDDGQGEVVEEDDSDDDDGSGDSCHGTGRACQRAFPRVIGDPFGDGGALINGAEDDYEELACHTVPRSSPISVDSASSPSSRSQQPPPYGGSFDEPLSHSFMASPSSDFTVGSPPPRSTNSTSSGLPTSSSSCPPSSTAHGYTLSLPWRLSFSGSVPSPTSPTCSRDGEGEPCEGDEWSTELKHVVFLHVLRRVHRERPTCLHDTAVSWCELKTSHQSLLAYTTLVTLLVRIQMPLQHLNPAPLLSSIVYQIDTSGALDAPSMACESPESGPITGPTPSSGAK